MAKRKELPKPEWAILCSQRTGLPAKVGKLVWVTNSGMAWFIPVSLRGTRTGRPYPYSTDRLKTYRHLWSMVDFFSVTKGISPTHVANALRAVFPETRSELGQRPQLPSA